ncbi:breast cancer anti-estrogen resistance protein 3 homolog [Neolamprologus brichardi]|uniref:breast cancer anti-estrogen resistance protein 3 homolog n=1 Tax=Neolamprologus brichardi TaxID=32507 RepID=UPI0003EC1DA1|nr:breast cancer anti-estrogen resistance protein 3 homolog [Neolamprologus brichardi]
MVFVSYITITKLTKLVAENLVQRDGDFLIRDSLSLPGSYVLTCQWRNTAQHFKINKKVVMLNEAYSRVEYRLDREGFDSIPALIRYYVGNRKPVSQVVGAIIFQPINRGLPLRCLEEKHGLSSSHRERLMSQERRNQKRLSLNITNGHTYDNTQAMHDSTHCQDNGIARGSQLRLKDRCGSQPASLNQVQERRHPLKAHQSESFLPLGQAIRGSDSQLCPKPPPKPSKVPLASLAHSSCPQARVPSSSSSNLTDTSCVSPRLAAPPQEPRRVETPDSSWASGATAGPPVPPVKPLKLQHLRLPADSCCSSGSLVSPADAAKCPDSETITGQGERLQPSPADLRSCSPLEWESSNSPNPITEHSCEAQLTLCSYVERLKREGETGKEEEEEVAGDRSSYHHAIAALENTSEEEDEDAGKDEEKDKRRKKERSSFQRPVIETESMFRPAEFDSRLLPLENKPLEMAVLKRAKELVVLPHPNTCARHILFSSHQVARILGVTPELKGQMGVSSGLELVTLPHGRQLRLDLMERYITSSPPVVCVPLPLPLLTLMERPSIAPDGVELWETSDQGCDIMLRHLEAARNVARNAHGYTANAQKILQGFQCDDDLLEVFKTDFQLRLLWGSRGATVNQSDRYNKFNLILTALSRKLEPPSTTPTII